MWQQRKVQDSMYEYGGPSRHHSKTEANLDDQLEMHDIAAAISVREVMNTEAGPLCYRYQ